MTSNSNSPSEDDLTRHSQELRDGFQPREREEEFSFVSDNVPQDNNETEVDLRDSRLARNSMGSITTRPHQFRVQSRRSTTSEAQLRAQQQRNRLYDDAAATMEGRSRHFATTPVTMPRSPIGTTTRPSSIRFTMSDSPPQDSPQQRASQPAPQQRVQQQQQQQAPVGTPMARARTATTQEQQETSTRAQATSVFIDGRLVSLRSSPQAVDKFVTTRFWNKETRKDLDMEHLAIFRKSATGFVLAKHKKLSVMSTKTDDDGVLTHVHSLQHQTKLLRDHMTTHDIVDVFHVVVPTDVATTPELQLNDDNDIIVYDLFQDYSKLTADMVAMSNAWYNMWTTSAYITENMTYSYELLQNNTEEALWVKCLEKYEEFSLVERGGPLMLYIILRRIQDTSESAIEFLKKKVEKLQIKTLKGEDVDLAVSLIKSTYTALQSASTPDRSYVPDDFPKTVLRVLQTTSVPDFNQAFFREEMDALHLADKRGGLPIWPSVSEILNLATNAYARHLAADTWHPPRKSRLALTADSSSGRTPGRKGNTKADKPDPICDNCGEPHLLTDCPKPRDPDRIKVNRAARLARHKRNPKHLPKRRVGEDGRPMIRNKHNAYVLDTKRWSQLQEKHLKSATNEVLKDIITQIDKTHVAPPPATPAAAANVASQQQSPPPTSDSSSALPDDIARIRGLLASKLRD